MRPASGLVTPGITTTLRWKTRRIRPLLRGPVVSWRHRKIRETDVFLASYPRSGRNWLGFMLSELLLDRPVEFAEEHPIASVDRPKHAQELLPGSVRLLRTHEMYRSSYRSAVYLIRHPGDVAISYFYFHLRIGIDIGFDTFFDEFLDGKVDGYGRWDRHVLSWLEPQQEARLLLVRYEDLLADAPTGIRRVSDFLGLGFEDAAIEQAVANNTFEQLRQREAARRDIDLRPSERQHPLVREGGSGSWKDVLSEGQVERMSKTLHAAMARAGYEP